VRRLQRAQACLDGRADQHGREPGHDPGVPLPGYRRRQPLLELGGQATAVYDARTYA